MNEFKPQIVTVKKDVKLFIKEAGAKDFKLTALKKGEEFNSFFTKDDYFVLIVDEFGAQWIVSRDEVRPDNYLNYFQVKESI